MSGCTAFQILGRSQRERMTEAMAPIWKDDPDGFAALLSELTNSLTAALGLSALHRRNVQQNADDAVKLEGQIDRAARAVKRLSNEDAR
jgi:hypothetical protein